MFDVSHAFQVSVFIKSAGMGALLGAAYIVFMLLRRSGIAGTAAVVVQDLLFFILAAIASFAFIFEVNAGSVRFYIFAGEAIGFCLVYMFPLRSLAVFIGNNVYKLRKKTFLLIEKINMKKNKKKSQNTEKNSKKLLHKS